MKRIAVLTMMVCIAATAMTACTQKSGSTAGTGDSVKKTETTQESTSEGVTKAKTGSTDSTTSDNEGKTNYEIKQEEAKKAEEASESLPVKKGSVIYELTINGVAITSDEITLYTDSAEVALSERVSEEVIDGKYRGDYAESGSENGIKDIDIPSAKDWLDGTTVTTTKYTIKDIKTGSSFHITLAEDIAKRLGFEKNVITVKVPEMQ